jgi:hypothetical protein
MKEFTVHGIKSTKKSTLLFYILTKVGKESGPIVFLFCQTIFFEVDTTPFSPWRIKLFRGFVFKCVLVVFFVPTHRFSRPLDCTEAKFLVPDWGILYSRLSHEVFLPARQPM